MTGVKPIPDEYHKVTPYLLVQGADSLIDFLEKAFDAKETARMNMPNGGIGHAEVRLGDSVIMLADAHGEYKPLQNGIYLYVDDCDAAYKRALEAGATSMMQPSDQFYGDRSATVKDQFGNHWYIATHIEDVSEEELQKRKNEYMKKMASD